MSGNITATEATFLKVKRSPEHWEEHSTKRFNLVLASHKELNSVPPRHHLFVLQNGSSSPFCSYNYEVSIVTDASFLCISKGDSRQNLGQVEDEMSLNKFQDLAYKWASNEFNLSYDEEEKRLKDKQGFLAGFFKKIFGRSLNQNAMLSSKSRRLTEADNVGMRCETQGEGEAYFVSLFQKDPEPIIFYFFDDKDKATQALADVSCIAVAEDNRKLICTDVLTFGVFPAVDEGDSPTWGALLAGKSLSHDTWSEARKCFKKHGGRMRREDEPENSTPSEQKKQGDQSLVKFSHERTDDSFGLATYVHYTAPCKEDALAWLQQNPDDKRSFFLVVETPDGTFARDIQGIYEN